MTNNYGVKKSKIQGNKKTLLSLSLILMLAMTLMMAFAQPTSAQLGVPQPEKTTGYIDFSPRLVGVGQEATVNLFIYPIPTNYAYQPYYDGYRGITVTFVKPDGTKDTFMPVDGTHLYDAGQTQSLGAIFFFYKPSMAGNWSVSFTMPAQNLTDVSGTVQMSGCTSKPAYFTVQTDPVLAGLLNGYPWSPLPNSNAYWSYPINSNNREWNQISGEWLGSSSTSFTVNSATQLRWQPYGSGPNTAHIVWKQQYRDGGIIGGDYGSISYGAQSSVINTVILEGKLFANIPNTTPVGGAVGKFECIDLTTGKVLYTANGTIAAGIHLPGNPNSQAGLSPTGNVLLESSFGSDAYPYLWGTATVNGITYWNYYDPLTGTLVRTISNASSSRLIDNSNLAYGVVNNNMMFAWNISKVVNNNWPTGIQWQKTLPASMLDAVPHYSGSTQGTITAKSLFGVSTDMSTIVVKAGPNQFWGYSTKDGTSLWNLTLNYPTTANQQFITGRGVEDLVIFDPTESTFKCYSILSGNLLWTSTSFNDASWATTWTVYWSETNDNQNLYIQFSDGTMRAYSLKDGQEVWRSKAIASTEYPNNAVPYVTSLLMVDGKLYGFAGYSSQYKINPISRHAMMICVNATNGDTIFTLNGGIRDSAAANGYVIGTGDFDGNLYCLGKGTTSTTLTAQQQVGGSVLIQGSILDTSPASSNADLTAKFPNGVPAISDADMSVWMDYLHMQNATLLNNPPNCIGVPVSLDALDANGNSIHIGTVTSYGSGIFNYQWTPTTPGLYQIYATFGGSNSYYSSFAETRATVASAATSSPAPTAQTSVSNSDMLMYFAIIAIAIIIAIAVATVLILRKK